LLFVVLRYRCWPGVPTAAKRVLEEELEMYRLLMMSALVAFGSLTGCIEVTPNPGGGPGGIQTNNVNTTNANSQIRLWILTEEEIASPPATKMEADELLSYVQPRFRTFTFNRDPGTYYVVASNEAHYQSLDFDDDFTPGVDFALLKVEEDLVPVSVRNTATPTRLPSITSP
jgi:hypothetical protein